MKRGRKRVMAFFLVLFLFLGGGLYRLHLYSTASLGASGEGAGFSRGIGASTRPGIGDSQEALSLGQSGEAAFAGARVIDAHTIEVTTYDELVDALRDVNYTDIYFGKDIEATAPKNDQRLAQINTAKTEQRIYGRAYGGTEIFTFTQYPSNEENYTIRVPGTSATTKVTVSDMKVKGYNYFGIVQVSTSKKGVTTRYENVTYEGPQPVHNSYGTVQFVNMDITIKPGYASSNGEIAEAAQIEFEGKNTINTNVSGNGNAVFNMYKMDGGNGKFHVKADAEVYISANSYLFYIHDNPELVFDEGSTFYAECGGGLMMQFAHSMVVGKGAKVTLIQNGTTNDYGVRVRNGVTVREGAVLEVLRPTGSAAAIQVSNSDGKVAFENPERVVIYASDSLLFGFAGSRSSISIETDAVNLWKTAAGGSSAGEPTQVWNKLGANKLVATSHWNSTTQTTATGSNLDLSVDPATSAFTNATFLPRSSQLLVLGRIRLDIGDVTTGDATVKGLTEPGALLSGTYTGDTGGTAPISGAADGTGTYELPLDSGFPQKDSLLHLTAYSGGLRMRQYTTVKQEEVLKFLSVPGLEFETTTIPTDPVYVRRADPHWAMTVQDTRLNSPGFRVDASVTSPLTGVSEGNTHVISDGLVYVNGSGLRTALSDTPLTVYTSTSGETGNHDIGWDDEQGVLVWAEQNGSLVPGVRYTTTVHWTLVASP